MAEPSRRRRVCRHLGAKSIAAAAMSVAVSLWEHLATPVLGAGFWRGGFDRLVDEIEPFHGLLQVAPRRSP